MTRFVKASAVHSFDKIDCPEKRLFIAVLSQAVHDAFAEHVPLYEKNQARTWLMSNSKDFKNICELSGRDSSYVLEKIRRRINEMMTSTSGGVAGMHQSITPTDGLPEIGGREADRVRVNKKKKTNETFAGCRVFALTSEEYNKCMRGRKKYERWNKKLNMEDINNQDIRSYAHRNPGQPIVIKDSTLGIMAYLIPPRGR